MLAELTPYIVLALMGLAYLYGHRHGRSDRER